MADGFRSGRPDPAGRGTSATAELHPAALSRPAGPATRPYGNNGRTRARTVAVGATNPIPGLRESRLFETCLESYQRHSGVPGTPCRCCQQPLPCPPRLHAMEVVEAAGDDPHRYDASGRIDAAPHSTAALDIHLAGPPRVQVLSATVVGYSVGGARRPPVPNYQWER